MKKLILCGIVFGGLALISMHGIQTCDAPLIGGGHTGAPGEYTCYMAGCHTGGADNGPGLTIVGLDSGVTQYIPGHTYKVNVKIKQAGITQFGFQALALKDTDNTLTGYYTLTDTINTRLIPGMITRWYVGPTACGADAPTPDSLSWSFNWTAPAKDSGNITFYFNTLASNRNHNLDSDNCYNATFHLTADTTYHAPPDSTPDTTVHTGIFEALATANFIAQTIPDNEHLAVSFALATSQQVQLSLFDINGRAMATLLDSHFPAGSNHQVIDIAPLHLSSGIYLLVLKANDIQYSRKIVVNR